jgi:hypothetical protein
VLFLLPFCAVGVGAAGLAVGELLRRGGDWKQAALLALFAVIFGGVGFGLLAVALRGTRRSREIERRRAAHPTEPWQWVPDWADGRVECNGRAGALALSGFAAVWMLISLPAAVGAITQELPKGNRAALLALAFPAVGVLLSAWAAVAVARWRKYGPSVLELAAVPGVVGGALAGTVHVGRRLEPEEGFTVSLTCSERRTTGAGRDRRTSESVLWQDEVVVDRSLATREADRTAVPFSFRIPFECREATVGGPEPHVVWRLHVEAEVPGADWKTAFAVPVFRTPDSSPEPPPVPPAREAPGPPRDPRLRVRRASGGHIEIEFPALRNPGVSLGLGVFAAAWWGIVVLLAGSDAPRIFPWVFGGFGVLLTWGWVSTTLGSGRVVAERGRLTVSKGLLGLALTGRSMPASSVRGLRVEVGMQVSGTRPRAYHRLVAELEGGRTLVLGSGVRSRREAEWCARRVEEALTGAASRPAG